MIRQDYILRLIEEAGKVLAKLFMLRTENKPEKAHELINRCYSGFFQFDVAFLNTVTHQDLLNWLLNDKQLHENQLIVLADLLTEEAQVFSMIKDTQKAHDRYSKALLILDYINHAKPEEYSFERMRKIQEIQIKLEQF